MLEIFNVEKRGVNLHHKSDWAADNNLTQSSMNTAPEGGDTLFNENSV